MADLDFYRLVAEINTNTATNLVINGWTFQQQGDLTTKEAGESLIDAFQANVQTAYRGLFHSNFLVVAYHVRGLTDPTYGFDKDAVNLAGTLTGSVLPSQVSSVASWRTGLIGRRFRGRTYLPPANEESLTDGLFAGSYRTNVINWGEDMITIEDNTESILWSLHVHSKAGGTFTPVTGVLNSVVPGVIRSRRLGSGA